MSRLDLLIEGPEFLAALAHDLPQAERYVYAQALTFEGDTAGRSFASLVSSSPASDRRLMIDHFSRHIVSDKCVWLRPWDKALQQERRGGRRIVADLGRTGVRVRYVNPLGPVLQHLLQRNHKKLVVLDDRVAYIGGINFSDHNFAWHDSMIRIEDHAAAAFLREDFLSTWGGRNVARSARFGALTLHSLDGSSNEARFAPLLDRIASARRSIFLECPYLTDPFLAALRAAARRGVTVTVVVPEHNNWSALGHCLAAEAARREIDVRFLPRMTHMKAMLLDDEVLVTGSANFDIISYRFQQEYLAEVRDPALLQQFRERIQAIDLAQAVSARPRPSASTLRWARWEMAGLQRFGTWAKGVVWAAGSAALDTTPTVALAPAGGRP